MNEYTLARGIGWLSVAVGTALVVAPKAAVSGFGMGERPRLGRFLGVKDLVIGFGILANREEPAPWLLARALSDAQDAGILIGGIATSAFPRDKALFGLTLAISLGVTSLALARRLK